jgi:hypothetical protein
MQLFSYFDWNYSASKTTNLGGDDFVHVSYITLKHNHPRTYTAVSVPRRIVVVVERYLSVTRRNPPTHTRRKKYNANNKNITEYVINIVKP